MGTASLPNTITPGTNENATQVQENDVALRDFLNSGTGIGTNNIAVLPACRVTNNAAISHATSGSFQALTFNTERFDTDSIHSTSANTGRLTCVTAGVYAISGHVEFAANATGIRAITIRLNGTTIIAHHAADAVTGGGLHQMSVATQYSLAATDYVELSVFQNSGGVLNVNSTGNYSPEFGMAFLTRAS